MKSSQIKAVTGIINPINFDVVDTNLDVLALEILCKVIQSQKFEGLVKNHSHIHLTIDDLSEHGRKLLSTIKNQLSRIELIDEDAISAIARKIICIGSDSGNPNHLGSAEIAIAFKDFFYDFWSAIDSDTGYFVSAKFFFDALKEYKWSIPAVSVGGSSTMYRVVHVQRNTDTPPHGYMPVAMLSQYYGEAFLLTPIKAVTEIYHALNSQYCFHKGKQYFGATIQLNVLIEKLQEIHRANSEYLTKEKIQEIVADLLIAASKIGDPNKISLVTINEVMDAHILKAKA